MSEIPRGRGRGLIFTTEGLSSHSSTSFGRGLLTAPTFSRGNISQLNLPRTSSSTAAEHSGGTSVTQREKRGGTRDVHAPAFYTTKPECLESKVGTSGNTVRLSSNYFRLIRKPEFEFNLYRVDFKPETDVLGKRKSLVFKLKETLGGYLFDGEDKQLNNFINSMKISFKV